MTYKKPKDLVEELSRLGIELTATRLADGTIKLNRWRTIKYWNNVDAAESLWAASVESDRNNEQALKDLLTSASA